MEIAISQGVPADLPMCSCRRLSISAAHASGRSRGRGLPSHGVQGHHTTGLVIRQESEFKARV